MKRIFFAFTLFCFASMAASAQMRSFTLPVYTSTEAELTAFIADKPTGRAILAFPGGGYHQTSIGNNAQWAPLYNSLGISFFILKYRMPEGSPEVTVGDALSAMQMIRDSSQVWHVDPSNIGVMGTSAGGHLAAMLATCAPETLKPAFQVLFYPVITFGEGCHAGSRDNFLGKMSTDKKSVEMYSAEKRVDSATPPAIIFASSDDKAVPPVYNSVAYYTAMIKNGCDASLHIYPVGGHGWTFASAFRCHDQVVDELTAWLKAL